VEQHNNKNAIDELLEQREKQQGLICQLSAISLYALWASDRFKRYGRLWALEWAWQTLFWVNR